MHVNAQLELRPTPPSITSIKHASGACTFAHCSCFSYGNVHTEPSVAQRSVTLHTGTTEQSKHPEAPGRGSKTTIRLRAWIGSLA